MVGISKFFVKGKRCCIIHKVCKKWKELGMKYFFVIFKIVSLALPVADTGLAAPIPVLISSMYVCCLQMLISSWKQFFYHLTFDRSRSTPTTYWTQTTRVFRLTTTTWAQQFSKKKNFIFGPPFRNYIVHWSNKSLIYKVMRYVMIKE